MVLPLPAVLAPPAHASCSCPCSLLLCLCCAVQSGRSRDGGILFAWAERRIAAYLEVLLPPACLPVRLPSLGSHCSWLLLASSC